VAAFSRAGRRKDQNSTTKKARKMGNRSMNITRSKPSNQNQLQQGPLKQLDQDPLSISYNGQELDPSQITAKIRRKRSSFATNNPHINPNSQEMSQNGQKNSRLLIPGKTSFNNSSSKFCSSIGNIS
jgi:hypothetical protein